VEVAGDKVKLNSVPVYNLSVDGLLANNDINATAIAISVAQEDPLEEELTIEFHVTRDFWEFYYNPTHTLRFTKPESVKAKSLVRIAYKGFDTDLPFENPGVDPLSEKLSHSHKEKIELMREGDYPLNPFQAFQVVEDGRKGGYKCLPALNFDLGSDENENPEMEAV